ncbi:MAG TPA: TonB-dependent receptor [Blastocatellia bacterium]|nr:TonB-dependent receptor [Blastocatellia bacterium]
MDVVTPMLCFIPPYLRKLTRALVVLALVPALGFSVIARQARSTASLRVTAHDEADRAVTAVVVELKRGDAVVIKTATDEKGVAEFRNLAPGTYDVFISKEGLETLNQTGVTVQAGAPVEINFTVVPKVNLTDTVTIQAGSDTHVEKTASVASELARNIVKELPVKPATVKDTLPLVPGVVRSPEGEIKISGQGEHRSALIVNSADVTDPATGQFGVTVPVDSVETINVFKTPYLAQYGRFTAGVVTVETRRGGDKWDFEINDPLPEFRIWSGQLRGVREASPRLVFNGPLIKDKLYFSEGVEYDLVKRPVRTLPFPFNETKNESVNSFTQLDYILSPVHTLTGTFHVAPRHMSFVGLEFFNPREVTPTLSAHDYTGTLIDRLAIGGNLLESTLAVKRFSGGVWGQGPLEMTLAPTGNSGNYFSDQARRASRIEAIETYSLAPIRAMGAHNLKFGLTFARTTNRGDFRARPVNIVDAEGRLIKHIDFAGSGQLFDRNDLEADFFAQDHWVLNPRLSVDVGTRFERQGITETMRVAPRVGIALTPFRNQETVIRGGYGLFYDRVPLMVYSFNRYPEQVVTTYGPDGEIIDGPRRFSNITDRAEDSKLPFIFSKDIAGNFAPYSATWNVEVEHPVTKQLRVRANYLQSNTYGVITITPGVVQGEDALVMRGSGRAGYRQLELTGRWQMPEGQQLFFSYVRSRTQGDLNEFNSYLGNFPFPVVRANQYTNLSADLPNRFLTWGLIKLPGHVRISPMLEWRNGFPYAVTNAAQDYVGLANTTRFPPFFSFDSRVSKDFKVSDKYALRLSVSGFNLTNHFNPYSVHGNIDDPRYGVFFGNYKRRFRLDFDVLF